MLKSAFLFLLTSICFVSYSQNKKKAYLITQQITQQLETKQYDSILMYFDTLYAQQMDNQKLRSNWEGLAVQNGAFQHFMQSTMDTLPGMILAQTIIQFSQEKMVLNISFNSNAKIVALYFTSYYAWSPPTYVNTLSFTEYAVSFGPSPYTVYATLTLPENMNSNICAIIIGTAGSTDKDMDYGVNKPYKDLAWGLATKGIAVLRYNKRNMNGNQLLNDKYAGKPFTIKEEYMDDAHEAILYLQNNPLIHSKRVILIGHGQGGMMAPLIAEKNKGISGIVMLAAQARPIQDVTLDEIANMESNGDIPEEKFYQTTLLKRKLIYSKNLNLKPNAPEDSLTASAAYWISLNKYNQVKTAKKLSIPMMIIQGERDYQVSMKDYTIWKENLSQRPSCVFKSYPKLDHHLIEGEGTSTKRDYSKRGNVPEYLVDDITHWITQKIGK